MVSPYLMHRRRAFRGFAPETTTLLAAFTGSYNTARQSAINDLIVSLKNNGIWSKLDVLCIAGLNSGDSLVNWKNPGTFNGTAANSPTFTVDRGFTFNGSTSYVNTNFTPSTAGGNYALNSAHLSVYSRTNNVVAATDIGANPTTGNAQSIIASRFTDGNCYYAINSSGQFFANTNSNRLLIANRTNSTSVQFYRDGVSLHSSTGDSSITVTNRSIWVGGRNNGSIQQPSTRQIASWSIGAGLTATEAANFNTALNTYLTYIGAAV